MLWSILTPIFSQINNAVVLATFLSSDKFLLEYPLALRSLHSHVCSPQLYSYKVGLEYFFLSLHALFQSEPENGIFNMIFWCVPIIILKITALFPNSFCTTWLSTIHFQHCVNSIWDYFIPLNLFLQLMILNFCKSLVLENAVNFACKVLLFIPISFHRSYICFLYPCLLSFVSFT